MVSKMTWGRARFERHGSAGGRQAQTPDQQARRAGARAEQRVGSSAPTPSRRRGSISTGRRPAAGCRVPPPR